MQQSLKKKNSVWVGGQQMAIVTEILKHWFKNTTLQYFSSGVWIKNNYITINQIKKKSQSKSTLKF